MASQSGKLPYESYAFLANLSIVQLENLLKNEAQSEAPNEEYLAAIEAAILRLEQTHPTGRITDVNKAWEEFQVHYLTEEGQGFELFDGIETDTPPLLHPKTAKKRFLRRIVVIAAVVALLVGLFIPQVLGYNHIFDMIAQWDSESFQFGIRSEENTEGVKHNSAESVAQEYDSMQSALEEHGIDTDVAPTWFPSGFELQYVNVDHFPYNHQTFFNAYYYNAEQGGTISFTVIQHGNQISDISYEKDNQLIENYIVNEITHYILQNNGRTSVCWYAGNLECSMIGDMTIDDARQMIDSIYER